MRKLVEIEFYNQETIEARKERDRKSFMVKRCVGEFLATLVAAKGPVTINELVENASNSKKRTIHKGINIDRDVVLQSLKLLIQEQLITRVSRDSYALITYKPTLRTIDDDWSDGTPPDQQKAAARETKPEEKDVVDGIIPGHVIMNHAVKVLKHIALGRFMIRDFARAWAAHSSPELISNLTVSTGNTDGREAFADILKNLQEHTEYVKEIFYHEEMVTELTKMKEPNGEVVFVPVKYVEPTFKIEVPAEVKRIRQAKKAKVKKAKKTTEARSLDDDWSN